MKIHKYKLKALVGKKIQRIFMNENYLRFEMDGDIITYEVEGDCCSRSVFYDFIGVQKLLQNGPVKSMEEVDLQDAEKETAKSKIDYEQDAISIYGVKITTESPKWGEQTSVVSFRNYSNGYYGGWFQLSNFKGPVLPEIFTDVLETVAPSDNDPKS